MYAQLVIGPPGSGKSTYCKGMKDFLNDLGRSVSIVNLDPANDVLPYQCDVDVSELISLTDTTNILKLGPNGGLVYCMEFLEKNNEWLHDKMTAVHSSGTSSYFLIDCPGQVELYTHNTAVKSIAGKLLKWNVQLVAVNLVDSHYCSDPATFVSVLVMSLSTMLQMELPHVNILSKIDLMQQHGSLPFGLDYYSEVLDLQYLLDHMSNNPFFKKYKKLNEALIGLIEDYSYVTFTPNKESMMEAARVIDKASGYVMTQGERDRTVNLFSMAYEADFQYTQHFSTREQFIKK